MEKRQRYAGYHIHKLGYAGQVGLLAHTRHKIGRQQCARGPLPSPP